MDDDSAGGAGFFAESDQSVEMADFWVSRHEIFIGRTGDRTKLWRVGGPIIGVRHATQLHSSYA
jgi:hypothetical protein